MSCKSCWSVADYLSFFPKLQTFVSEEIQYITNERKSFWLDLIPTETMDPRIGTDYVRWDAHEGPTIQFSGLEIFEKINDLEKGKTAFSGANDLCSYGPFHTVPGLGFERRGMEGFRTNFASEKICIDSIVKQGLAPDDFMEKYILKLGNYAADVKEQTNRNLVIRKAKKYLAQFDQNGELVYNHNNEYDFPTIGGTDRLSAPSYDLLLHLYDSYFRPYAQHYAIDVMEGGEPIIPVILDSASKRALVTGNQEIVTNLQYSSMADSLLQRYAPLDKIGPFVLIVDNDCPRLKRNAVTGALEVVFKWVEVPIESGSRYLVNPEWSMAGYRTMLIPSKDNIKKYIREMPTTLAGADFGDRGYDLNFIWVNFPTEKDPLRKVGQYMSEYEFFVEYGGAMDPILLVHEAENPYSSIIYRKGPAECPDDTAPCNIIETSGCPCAQIECFNVSLVNPTQAEVRLSLSLGAVEDDTITFKTVNGGTAAGTVLAVAADGRTYTLEFTLPSGTALVASDFVEPICEVVSFCSAKVLGLNSCRDVANGTFKITLDRPLACNADGATLANDVLLAKFGDGTTQELVVTALNLATLEYTVRYNAGFGPTDDSNLGVAAAADNYDVCCDRGGIREVCCKPTETNDCPACERTLTACEVEEEEEEGEGN
jgi:hypothetical protein